MLKVRPDTRKGGGGGGGGGAVGFWPDTKSGDLIAYQEARIPDIVRFMRTGINRQRKRTAIIIKRGPNLYMEGPMAEGYAQAPGAPPWIQCR